MQWVSLKMKALCWIKSMYKTERNLPLTITSDVLVDIFSFCTRNDLDCIQLVCKRFNTIVKTSFKKHPIRVIYAVLVEKPVDQEGGSIMNPTIIIYSKDSLLKREFKSLEDVLALKQKQNVAFLNISIYHEDVDIEEVKKKKFSLMSESPINLHFIFYYDEYCHELVPEFQSTQFSSSLYSSHRKNFQLFNSRTVEFEYPMENDSLYNLPLQYLLIWLEFNNETTNSATLKLYKTNYYRFVEPLDVLVDIIFQSFQSQNKPCQYEIVVTDLQEINVSACKINKTARNYVTNEVMESIFLKYSQDESLRKNYNDADWVLRRRLSNNVDFSVAFDKSKAHTKSMFDSYSYKHSYKLWFK